MRDALGTIRLGKRAWSATALLGCALAMGLAWGGCSDAGHEATSSGESTSAGAIANPTATPTDAAARQAPRTRQGSTVALTPDSRAVLVADETHEALFVANALLEPKIDVVPLPGPPAQIVALDGLVFVTIRTLPTDASRAARDAIRGAVPDGSTTKSLEPIDTAERDDPQEPLKNHGLYDASKPPKAKTPAEARPTTPPAKSSAAKPGPPSRSASSAAPKPAAAPPQNGGTRSKPLDGQIVKESQGGLLLALRPDAAGHLAEVGRVVIAADAWGLALTPNDARAIVTSAWTHEITVVDVSSPEAMRVVTHASVAREPRGVAITADGKSAFVSHLVGAPLTKITNVDGEPAFSAAPLPTALARGPQGIDLHATLAYSLVLSPDDKTLFVPRHALGAGGMDGWWGATTVDTMDVATGAALQPKRVFGSPSSLVESTMIQPAPDWGAKPATAPSSRRELVQPRAAVYRASTNTILIASEGEDAVAEVDALAADPAMAVTNVFWLGREYDKFGHYSESGGAPSGLVLSPDEKTAYVFCSTTFDLVKIDLDTKIAARVHLADDGLPLDAARGRRLFSNASSPALSGGLACSGCHPDGRDDGYTWREGDLRISGAAEPNHRFVALRENVKLGSVFSSPDNLHPDLHPRQTPMLAGRVRASGPYGWHGENANLLERLHAGFELHREAWGSPRAGWMAGAGEEGHKIDLLIDYAQSGLMPPPVVTHPMTDQEKHGKELFESKNTQCATCHTVEGGYSDRKAHELLPLPVRPGFDKEAAQAWKTPMLWFVEGTAPYFHDGSADSLDALVSKNGTRMGSTQQLSADDQSALVAYLKTL